nr:MAG TPA: hypothetical protein [Caudoviricetes sp.]
MDRYYSDIVKVGDFSFYKVKKLYGILAAFKNGDNYFRIESKNGKFKLTSCSFLILLSLIGLKEQVNITLVSNNLDLLRQTKNRILRIV